MLSPFPPPLFPFSITMVRAGLRSMRPGSSAETGKVTLGQRSHLVVVSKDRQLDGSGGGVSARGAYGPR